MGRRARRRPRRCRVQPPTELYLTLARWTDEPGATTDYTGQQVFYRSLQQRTTDRLTVHDYLWRWDTDWFWCSRAFGAQHPLVRRVWPRRLRRSDVYWRLVALDRRLGVGDRLDRVAGRPRGERVVQDVEVPVERLPEFLDWFDREIGMRPVWLCPLRLRRDDAGERPWPGYPLSAGDDLRQRRVLGRRQRRPRRAPSPRNRAIEAKVSELGGHKSLYSEAFYDREEFDRLYGGAHLAPVKALPRSRRPADVPLRQGGAPRMTRPSTPTADPVPSLACSIGEAMDRLVRGGLPLHFTAYDGSSAGPPRRRARDAPAHRARTVLPDDRTRRPRHGARLRQRRPGPVRGPPRRPVRRARAAQGPHEVPGADAVRGRAHRPQPGAVPPAAAAPAAAGAPAPVAARGGGPAPLDDARRRGDLAPLRRLEPFLRARARPVDGLHLRPLRDT